MQLNPKLNRKILVLDIETAPAVVYAFQAFKVNISHEQVISPVRMICFAGKFIGENKVHFFSEWTHTKEEMLLGIRDLLDEADAVVTYNGDRFDLPKMMGEFALAGIKPPAPVTSIDVLKAVKKFGLYMNRLAFVGPLFNLGEKLKHEGFSLWSKVLDGDPKARKRMEKYNIQDVRLLEKLYKKILPYITNHPHLGKDKHSCGACGSNNTQSRGYRRTKTFLVQRIQCQDCGSWGEGTRSKVK